MSGQRRDRFQNSRHDRQRQVTGQGGHVDHHAAAAVEVHGAPAGAAAVECPDVRIGVFSNRQCRLRLSKKRSRSNHRCRIWPVALQDQLILLGEADYAREANRLDDDTRHSPRSLGGGDARACSSKS